MISIRAESIGQNFATIGIAQRSGMLIDRGDYLCSHREARPAESITTEPYGYKCDTAACRRAYELALKAGWFRELRKLSIEVTPAVEAAARRAGVQILLGCEVVVDAAVDPACDWNYTWRFEAELARMDKRTMDGY